MKISITDSTSDGPFMREASSLAGGHMYLITNLEDNVILYFDINNLDYLVKVMKFFRKYGFKRICVEL